MAEQNQQTNGASSGNEQTPSTQPKLEVKDGSFFIDGHKYTKESDLIAAKKSLETQLSEQQKVHNDAYDKARLELSSVQQQVAAANAKVKELSDAQQKGAGSSDDLAKAKSELDQVKKQLSDLSNNSLTYRKKYLQAVGGVSEDQLKDMSATDLDGLEKALLILGKTNNNNNPGNYAAGGGRGSTTPLSAMDRARALIAATPQTGVRNAQTNN